MPENLKFSMKLLGAISAKRNFKPPCVLVYYFCGFVSQPLSAPKPITLVLVLCLNNLTDFSKVKPSTPALKTGNKDTLKVTQSSPYLGPPFTPKPLLEWYLQSKEILLNLGMKC